MSHRLRRGLVVACCLALAAALPWLSRGSPDATADKTKADYTVPTLGMKLKRIRPGKFLMGSPKDEDGRNDNEGPQHEVEITQAFFMGAFPVTKGQFAKFVKDDGYQTEAEKADAAGLGYNADTKQLEIDAKYNWRNPGFAQTDEHPVVLITWNDAQAFCAWLSKKEGKTYELPTEAEWEYACRAGTQTRFWCGDADESIKGNANIADVSLKGKLNADFANICTFASWDDGYAFTSPVGALPPNRWGLYDMAGNVWQWCADGYGDYQEEHIKDPKGNDRGDHRVLRGGSWGYGPRDCRSARRFASAPAFRSSNFGFRVVLRLSVRTP